MDAEAYATHLRCELKNKGYSLALIAEEVGVSTSLVSKTLKRQRKSELVEARVASVLGVPALHLWNLNFRDTLFPLEAGCKGDHQRKAS